MAKLIAICQPIKMRFGYELHVWRMVAEDAGRLSGGTHDARHIRGIADPRWGSLSDRTWTFPGVKT